MRASPCLIFTLCFLASCGDNGGSADGGVVTPPAPPPPPPHAPWASAIGTDAFGTWADLTVTGNGETAVQRFRLISPGSFTMGSPTSEVGRDWYGVETESQHQVTLTTPYWIADSECTQRMWKAMMNATPSFHRPPNILVEDLDLPVEQVSRTMIQAFITSLNSVKTNLSGRLPTEGEWEYAARAGSTTPFSVSPVTNNSINCAVYAPDAYVSIGIDRHKTVAVKTLPPNPWGLYEVHGNVGEWCSDRWQDDLGSTAVTDPSGPSSGTYGVVRGGSWVVIGGSCRSGIRIWDDPSIGSFHQGFRLAVPAQPSGGG